MRMLTRLSLRNRLLLSLILVASVSIVAATLFSIRYFSGKMYAEVSRNMQIKGRVAESIVRRSMNDLHTFAQTLAVDPPLRLMVTHHLETKIPGYLSEKTHNTAAQIVVFDKNRQRVAKVIAGREILDAAQDSFVSQALRTERSHMSLRQIPLAAETLLVMTVAMPINSRDGQLIGVVLVERILNDDRELIEQLEELLDVTAVLYAGEQAVSFHQKGAIAPQVARGLMSGEQQHYEVKEMRRGGELAEFSPLYDSERRPVAILGIFQPADAYVRTRDEAIVKLLVIMLGCLVLASVLGFTLAKSVLEPIHQLSTGVRQISAGDLDHRILLDSRDELGALAAAFNTMASQLRESFGKIHDQVEEIAWASEERESLVVQLQHQNGVLQREIAERKRAEEERQSLEIQLRQIHKLEALGTLAGGVAHDFNNILAIILMHAEMLLEEARQDEQRARALNRIIQAGERGADLVRQILVFSQVKEHERVAIKLGPILEESLKMLRTTIPAGIAIQHDIQPDCPVILADATQIHQVIVNLCVNAGHAMKEQGGVLEVNLKTVNYTPDTAALFAFDDASVHVMLEIKDSGGGMSPEVRERVFEPFFTTKAVGEGSGLGLSVVHGIVKSHQGEIEVKSVPGEGTSVQVFFPAVLASEAENWEEAVTQPPEHAGSVMIVDDEMDLLTLYTMQLTELGYLVTAAVTDGDEALSLYQADPTAFNLVLTDQSMAGMSGMELSERMLEIQPTLPIILITGHSETRIKKEAQAKGIRSVLTKPLKMSVLKHAVQEIMRGEGGEESDVAL